MFRVKKIPVDPWFEKRINWEFWIMWAVLAIFGILIIVDIILR